jgi:hypothetical protein
MRFLYAMGRDQVNINSTDQRVKVFPITRSVSGRVSLELRDVDYSTVVWP